MRTVHAVLIAALALSTHVEAHDRDTLLLQLREARARWEQNGAEDYVFTISNGCFCMHPPYVGPLRLTVRNGAIKRTVYLGRRWGRYAPGQTVRTETYLRTTIPDLFSEIERMIGAWKPEYIQVEYDSTDGHPVRFQFDDPRFEDEQTDIHVVELRKQ